MTDDKPIPFAPVEKPVEKPGFKTSEFWLVAATVLVGLLIGSGAIPAESVWAKALGFIASALASMGYSYSRAKVKASASPPEE